MYSKESTLMFSTEPVTKGHFIVLTSIFCQMGLNTYKKPRDIRAGSVSPGPGKRNTIPRVTPRAELFTNVRYANPKEKRKQRVN